VCELPLLLERREYGAGVRCIIGMYFQHAGCGYVAGSEKVKALRTAEVSRTRGAQGRHFLCTAVKERGRMGYVRLEAEEESHWSK
jgi:hypothetical protein